MNDLAVPLKTGLAEGASRLDVMNFLNEIADVYPQAISFAAGRPAEAFFDLERCLQRVPEFLVYLAQRQQLSARGALNLLAQYGRTNGLINELIARQVQLDEGIACRPERLLVTAGCQEAMDLCVTTLCRAPGDVVLARSPTYIGITGIADLNGIAIEPFNCPDDAGLLPALQDAAARAERQGRRPRVLYLVPDFDNPTGTVLSCATREAVIRWCADRRIVVLEDNPYGMFRFEGEPVPRMARLDAQLGRGCVIYLGTYSKTICPALRVGCLIVPETLFGDRAAADRLVGALSQAKSFVTVNTSQVAQAVVGAVLLAEDGSLARRVAPATEFYHRNRDVMLAGLQQELGGIDGIHWNVPEGGFFLAVRLPFPFRHREAESCARDYGVLTLPMSFFALNGAEDHRVRLAFSYPQPEQIREGVARFGRFVRDRLAAGGSPLPPSEVAA